MNELDLTYDDTMIIRVALHELINSCKSRLEVADEVNNISASDKMQLAQVVDKAQAVYDKLDFNKSEED